MAKFPLCRTRLTLYFLYCCASDECKVIGGSPTVSYPILFFCFKHPESRILRLKRQRVPMQARTGQRVFPGEAVLGNSWPTFVKKKKNGWIIRKSRPKTQKGYSFFGKSTFFAAPVYTVDKLRNSVTIRRQYNISYTTVYCF